MSALVLQFISLLANLIVFFFIAYYFLRLRDREKNLEEKEKQLDANYNSIIGGTIAREKQIIEGAMNESSKILQTTTTQATQILQGAQYISKNSVVILDQAIQKLVAETKNISSTSTITLDQALQKIVVDVQKQALDASQNSINTYSASLKTVTTQSLQGLEIIAKNLELDLQKQISDFNQTLLPHLEKEVDEYKKMRLKQAEQTVNKVVQRASQEIFGKLITTADHQNVMLESLEKAKKQGVFD